MVGSAVGPYQIVEKLGAGGMGEVFLGHDPRLQRRVALKCLTSAPNSPADERARVLREARAAARLNHPNIAGVYDVLEQDDRTYIVMEYVEGESLAARLQEGPLAVEEIRSIGRQISAALAAAHAEGVIHRDLKPGNIQVTRDGTIKVLDFGVAKLAPKAVSTSAGTSVAQPGAEPTVDGMPGTPVYMSPEQLFGLPLDARSDIYSAGVILYQMATGRRPYAETGAVALALAMSVAAPPPACELNAAIPQDLSDAIAKALARNAAQRFQSARDLEVALAGSAATAAFGGVRPAASTPSRFWKWAVGIALVASIALAALSPVFSRFGWTRTGSVATRPAVLAILPLDNPSGDIQADHLGAGVAELVAANLGSIRGLTVLPRTATAAFRQRRNDLAALQRDVGASVILDMVVRAASPRLVVFARLRRPGVDAVDWEQTIEGDVLAVEQTLLENLGRALERTTLQRRLSATEWARVRAVPTTSAEALQSYSEARALLDRADIPGNVDRAIALLTQSTKSDPRFAAAYAAIGDAQWIRYQNVDRRPEVAAQATAAVMEALKIDPDLAPVHLSLANMLFQTGRYQEALESVGHALAIQPDSDDGHRVRGRVLVAQGSVDAGLAELRKAVELRPYWNNYYNLGYSLYMTGRYREAIDALTKTTELQPTFSGAYQMLGVTFHMLGDLPQAIGNYEHAVRLGPNASAYANLAFAYYTAGRYDQALDAYLSAVKRNERSALLHRNLGDVYTRLRRPADARAAYQQAITLAQDDLKVNPRNASAVALIALCEAKIGRKEAAERHAAEAAVIAPADRDVRLFLAKVYNATGNRAAGLDALRAAVMFGYEPKMAREDDELGVLRKDAGFEPAIAAGMTARNQRSDKGATR